MSDLETLKRKHPEWCFGCGIQFSTEVDRIMHDEQNECMGDNLVEALATALQQHEATIAELKERAQRTYESLKGHLPEYDTLRSDLDFLLAIFFLGLGLGLRDLE